MPKRTLLIIALAGTVAVGCAVGAWAAIASPWGAAVVRDVAAGVAPPSPATIDGSETYLAAELDGLVVTGAVLLDAFGVSSVDGDLGVDYRADDMVEVEPQGCREMVGVGGMNPAGYRSRRGGDFASEVFLLSSVAQAADEYGALLRASGRCDLVEVTRDVDAEPESIDYTERDDNGLSAADAVHWFAGTRTDAGGTVTMVVTVTSGNLLQRFTYAPVLPTVDATQAGALAEAVAERLTESALRTLQTRNDDTYAEGYASGVPTPPAPQPTSGYSLALAGRSSEPAAPLATDFFRSAPVPWLCNFSGGTLVDGVLPGYAEQGGGVYLRGPDHEGLFAVEPEPTASSAAGALVVDCDHGGVGWPSWLVLYSADGRILDSIGVEEITPGGWRDPITEIGVDGDGYRVAWSWEDQDGLAPGRACSAVIRWDGARIVVSDLVIGERP